MNALELADALYLDYSADSVTEAADMLRQQQAEIDRLTQQFDPDTHAHRQDCCGPQIDTHCLGCTMAEGDAHAAEIARLTEKCDWLLSTPPYHSGYFNGFKAGIAFATHRAATQIDARAHVVGEQPWYGAIASELFAMAERIRNEK